MTTPFSLSGRTALVTGANTGIGQAIAVAMARAGAHVIAAGRSNCDETVALTGGETLALDFSDPMVARDVFATRPIDILVNNAGGMVARKTLAEMDEEFFNFVMQLNVTSAFLVTKATVPHMGEGSAIINLASLAGRDGGGGGAIAYATSKGAVMTMTRGLAKELGPRGIRVNALCPGMIATAFHDKFTPDAARENVANSTSLKRQGRAEEIGDAVAYLASDEASFINGANIDINGGLAFS